ncbi:MAG: hypothetical protein L0211_09835 [Planctomycetaceae bacterium]|nr:hypothetical protein [Planctomycetaceae bacterium]
MSQPATDVWEARPPPQLILAVSLAAVLVTLNGFALGHLVSTGQRTPQTVGAAAIGLACAQVAVATIFFTLGAIGFARKAIFVLAAIAYGGGLVAAAATKPIRWDASCGELFILATIVAVPGVAMRLAGLRLIHRSVPLETEGKPWQFSLEGAFVLLTAVACFLAGLRWIASSQASGVGVILEWMLLVSLPWIAVLMVSLPIHPLASLAGVFATILMVSVVAGLFGAFLNRPALGLTASVELILAAAMLAAMRAAGYEIRLARPD